MHEVATAQYPTVGANSANRALSLRVAVVRRSVDPGHSDENRGKTLGFAAQALERGADVVLSHDKLLLGCLSEALSLPEPVDGPTAQGSSA